MCRKGFFLITILFVSLFSFGQKTPTKPVSKTPPYIIHMVKFGETLTKIAKEYSVSKTDILKANPSMIENEINPDQIIRIPNTGNKKLLTDSNTNDKELQPKVKNSQDLVPKTSKYHIVLSGETMYHISKLYGITVEEIQKWNELKDFNVKVGSLLIVTNPKTSLTATSVTATTTNTIDLNKAETEQIQMIKTEKPVKLPEIIKQTVDTPKQTIIETEKPDIEATDNETQKELSKLFKEKAASGSVLITKGTGAPMMTTLGAMVNVYFAMHKTVAIGTIIKIKNLVNSKIVYAKVIGKLPETDENKHVIVRYSLGVKKDLQLQNGKCYVQLEYPH